MPWPRIRLRWIKPSRPIIKAELWGLISGGTGLGMMLKPLFQFGCNKIVTIRLDNPSQPKALRPEERRGGYQLELPSMKTVKRLLILGVAASLSMAASAADISGAGATFPYPIYAKWADAYKKLTGIGLNYQSIGSGGGIKQIKAKTVTFGASDMPLEARRLEVLGTDPIPHDHRWGGTGGQHQGRRPRVNCVWTAPRLPPFTWATSRSGTMRRSRNSIPS